jgi:hypothetical protein
MSKPQFGSQSVLMNVEPASAGSLPVKPPVDKTFRCYDQDQPMLLAPDLRDWLAADHPARWVDDLVEHGLDLSGVYAGYTEVRGAPPYVQSPELCITGVALAPPTISASSPVSLAATG